MKFQTKATALAIKSIGEDGIIEGYGSTFGNKDLGDDIVCKGAFVDTIAQRGPRGIKMLYEHNTSQPIGVWEELREDDTGLWVRGRLLIDTVEKAREAYALMKAGVIDALSIGYSVVNARKDHTQGARLLETLDLREISAVIFPMNEAARLTAVKHGELPTEREFEAWLTQDAGLSRSQARTIIRDGFKALTTAKPGAGDGEKPEGGTGELARMLAELNNQIRS